MKNQKLLYSLFIALLTLSSCVDLPESGITPPDYNAQVRIIYTDPSLQTATVSLASGPSFQQYGDISTGTFGTATNYLSFPAGAKRILVKRGDGTLADIDTTSLTFGTETVTSLLVMPRSVADEVRVRQIGERNTFASPGIPNFATVRFVNCLASKDTVDVWRIRGSLAAGIGADNLRYDRSTAFFNVPQDSVWRFYLTRASGATGSISDTTAILGRSNKQVTVVLYDSLSRIKSLKLEE